MRLTLGLGPSRPWADVHALAVAAERAGWDAVRCVDPQPGAGRECWAVLGALAVQVPRVRLDAAIRDDARRHPAVVAKLASTVDRLSGGRLLLGVSPAAGADGETRLAEGFEVVKRLVGGSRTSWRGRFYQLQDARLDPTPVQQPFPLMLLGGEAEMAATYASHWSISGDIEGHLAALADACHRHGRDRATVTVSADAPVNGVDELVVPDSDLGPDRGRWPAELTKIRAATS